MLDSIKTLFKNEAKIVNEEIYYEYEKTPWIKRTYDDGHIIYEKIDDFDILKLKEEERVEENNMSIFYDRETEKRVKEIIAKEDERCRQEEMKKKYWRWMHSLANVLNPMIENLSLVLDEDKMYWEYIKKFTHDESEVNDLCYLHDVFRNTSEGSFIIHCLENRLKENKALKYFTSMTMLYFKKIEPRQL